MEETTPSPKYLKGFNEGYILAKETPDLAEKISKAKSNGERLLGFQDGVKEYSLEKLRDLRPKRVPNISNPTKGKDKGIDMDR